MESGFWYALGIGGVLVAILSAGQQFIGQQQESFRVKPVVRDFLFGAFLSSLVYYLMPDTVVDVIEKGKDSIQSLAHTTAATKSLEFDLHTGPARF